MLFCGLGRIFQTVSTSDENGSVVFEKLYSGIDYWLDMEDGGGFGTSTEQRRRCRNKTLLTQPV